MNKLFEELSIKPNDLSYYERALTHTSFANEKQVEHYERLEFLGDSVIQLIVSEYLFEHDPSDEGILTKRRAQCVREEALNLYAETINLTSYINLGKGEAEKGANASIIADVFEAIMAAIYLDLGYQTAKEVFTKILIPLLEEVKELKDYKSQLQEFVAVDRKTLKYECDSKGPSNKREFTARVYLEGTILLGSGFGYSKKEAEQQAAKVALSKLAKGT